MNLENWTPAEIEFFAEDTLVKISPSFRGEAMDFVTGSYGPFQPAKPIQVPMWLAIYLRNR